MQIYDALKQDHDQIKTILNELLAIADDSPQRKELVMNLRDILVPHSRAEERVFYNSLREEEESKGKAMHGYAEHMAAETMLRSLQVMEIGTAGWKPIVEKLKKALDHHIAEEETEMFAEARQILTDEEAESMAVAFQKLKSETKDENFMQTTIDMVANLMPPRFTNKFRGQDAQGKH
jgi:hemerythrin superfamily protein